MTIQYLSQPEKQACFQIQNLITACSQYESITFSSQNEECSYVLLYDNQILLSFISLFFPDKELCECIGFTHPKCRRQGYFSQCLDKVCDILEQREHETGCQIELVFLSDGKSQDATVTLKALEAELWYSEHMMEISAAKLMSRTEPFAFLAQLKKPAKDQFQILADERLCGSFHLYESSRYACLYEFFVEPEYRNRGLAMAALYHLGTYLKEEDISMLRLEVSSLNSPALSLYKKAGFQALETLSYYLY